MDINDIKSLKNSDIVYCRKLTTNEIVQLKVTSIDDKGVLLTYPDKFIAEFYSYKFKNYIEILKKK